MIRNDLAQKSMFLRLKTVSILSLLALGAAVGLATSASAVTGLPKVGGQGKSVVRVSGDAEAERLIGAGGRLVASYESFKLIEIPASLDISGKPDIEPLPGNNIIRLNVVQIDTASAKAQESRAPVGSFEGKRLHLVSFVGPTKPEWSESLERAGAKIVHYVPNNAYLVYGDQAALTSIQSFAPASAFIQWDGEYSAAYKVQATDRLFLPDGKLATDLFTVQMVGDEEANPVTVGLLDQLKVAPFEADEVFMNYRNVRLRLSAEALSQIASRPDVVSVIPDWPIVKADERQSLLVAGRVSVVNGALGPAKENYFNWLGGFPFADTDYSKNPFSIDITDTSIDNATTQPIHFGLYPNGDTNLPSRVVYVNTYVSTNGLGCDEHGTIDAHIAAGFAIGTNFPYAEAPGTPYRFGLGVAPFVRIGSSVVFGTNGQFTTTGPATIVRSAYSSGARISNNSWGNQNFGVYDVRAQQYDSMVRDASLSAGNQGMVLVFAAGNSGSQPGTIWNPGTAKNIITVGASENLRPEGFEGSDNANDMADFSSRGPTRDGRKKPEIVAPGRYITGGLPQKDASQTNGNAADCILAIPPSFIPQRVVPPGQELYSASQGTSQAAPAVAGAAALIRQRALGFNRPAPSPAATKAILMNSARYLVGDGADDDRWSNSQGMGLVNLDTAFDGSAEIFSDQQASQTFTNSGGRRVFTGTISDSNSPVRITLAWTDAPGSTFGAALVNDLDLVVRVGGKVYRGNVFSKAYSVEGGSRDSLNNVESVILPPGTSGAIAIEVVGANISGDGVPGNASFTDQDFALLAVNIDESPIPVFDIASSQFVSEAFATTNGYVDPGETVTFDFSIRNVGLADSALITATIRPDASLIPVVGVGTFTNLIQQGASRTARFTFQVASNVPCGTILPVVLDLDESGTSRDSVTFLVKVGFEAIIGRTFANVVPITVPAFGTASPYPSSVNLTGFVKEPASISPTLFNLNHAQVSDLTVVLVNPNGVGLVLLSGAGSAAVAADVTFSDDAPGSVTFGTVTTGAYRPTGGTPNTNFINNIPAFRYVNTLSQLKALSGNGEWSLYVIDTLNPNQGRIEGGWSLFTTEGTDYCNAILSDLVVTKTASPDRLVPGDLVTYSITLSNRGPATAQRVVHNETLSSALSFVKGGRSQGSFGVTNNVVTFDVGTLTNGQVAALSVVARVILPTPAFSSSSAISSSVDPVTNNSIGVAITSGTGRIASNTNRIVIPDVGASLPYPSTISVSGVTGLVNRVKVSLNGIAHTYPRDIDVLLVSPTGEKVMLLSDTGPAASVTNLNLTFSDDALGVVPIGGVISGNYKPTDNDSTSDVFPAPAPAGPYGSLLSAFAGQNPNGTWSLYVADDTRLESGSIEGGWSLELFIGNDLTNDIGIVQSLPATTYRGIPFTTVLTVTNVGPTNASGVYVTNLIPDNAALVSVTPSQGSFSISGNRIVASLGSLAKNASATVQVVLTPLAVGSITNVALVSTDDNDPASGNNASVALSQVVLPPGVLESASPLDIPEFGPATIYPSTIVASNLTGKVGKVTVTLFGLSHTFPTDLDILLVGPGGQSAMLMSKVGAGNPANNLTLKFDDAAVDQIPLGFLQSGVYRPRNLSQAGENLPAPAPAGPYSETLSSFVGSNPNGTWSLYIADHGAGDSGSLAVGWTMTIEIAPELKIRKSNADLLLTWPSSASNFVIQGTSALSTNYPWTNLSLTPVVIGSENVITNKATNQMQFFRLVR